MSYMIVDEMHQEHPELVRDPYWDTVFPPELPYTLDSEPFREQHPLPSTANIAVMASQSDFINSSLKLNNMQSEGDINGAIMFSANPRKMSLQRMMSQGSNISDNTGTLRLLHGMSM